MMNVSTRRRGALALLVPGLAIALTACGSSGGSSRAASGTSTTAAPGARADFAAYAKCLSEHGVTMPTGGPGGGRPGGMPTGGAGGMPTGAAGGMPTGAAGGGPGRLPLPSGVDATAFQKAQTACASLRPTGSSGRPGTSMDTSALKAFTSCMKDHGVTVSSGLQGLNRSDSKVAAALRVCDVLLPTPSATGPAPTATTSPTSTS